LNLPFSQVARNLLAPFSLYTLRLRKVRREGGARPPDNGKRYADTRPDEVVVGRSALELKPAQVWIFTR
jgi:hypothetical protein